MQTASRNESRTNWYHRCIMAEVGSFFQPSSKNFSFLCSSWIIIKVFMDLTSSDVSNLMEKWHAGNNPTILQLWPPPCLQGDHFPWTCPKHWGHVILLAWLKGVRLRHWTSRFCVDIFTKMAIFSDDSLFKLTIFNYQTMKLHSWLIAVQFQCAGGGGSITFFLLPFRLPELPIPSDLCSFWLRTNSKKRSFKLCSNYRSENCWTTNPFLNALDWPGFSPLLSGKGLSRFWVDALGESARPGGKSRGRFTSKGSKTPGIAVEKTCKESLLPMRPYETQQLWNHESSPCNLLLFFSGIYKGSPFPSQLGLLPLQLDSNPRR